MGSKVVQVEREVIFAILNHVCIYCTHVGRFQIFLFNKVLGLEIWYTFF